MIWRTFQVLRGLLLDLWARPLLGSAATGTECPHPNATANSINPRVTIVVVLFLTAMATATAYYRASMFAPVIYNYYGYGAGPLTTNLLFDADVPRHTALMTDRRNGLHGTTNRHPLLSLYLYPPVKILSTIGLSPLQAIRTTAAVACGVWTLLMFSLLVLWGCRVLDAVVFTVLSLISASSLFWFSVPESFAIASATIIGALILTLWPQSVHPIARYTAATALSLSMTLTNAMVGLIASLRRFSTKDVWIVGASAWFIVSMLWAVQKKLFPAAEFFFPPPGEMRHFLYAPTPSRILQTMQVMLSHTMVMPDITVLSGADLGRPDVAERMMSVQRSYVGSGGLLGSIATIAWLALLGLGAWAFRVANSGLSIVCLLAAAGQICLHLVFGPETFLYTLNLLPLLIVLVAGVSFTAWRLTGLGLAIVVILLGGANNWTQFQKAVAVTHEVDAYARSLPGARPP